MVLLWLAMAATVMTAIVHPIVRRIAVFYLRIAKYALWFVGDWVGVRRVWAWVQDEPYERMTLPMAVRWLFEDMGPTFVKFGQIIASSTGVFPERYSEELRKCLDSVRRFRFSAVEHTVESELGDLATRLARIEVEPLASASIAQVHAAVLDDGSDVVIKVQRPGIHARVAADITIMTWIARMLAAVHADIRRINPVGVVTGFAATLAEEMDFRLEANNLTQFNDMMAELGHEDVRAPVPTMELTTKRLLVMSPFYGIRVDEVEEIHRRGINAEDSLVKGVRAWFQSVVFYGFFHGDVHAGNLMLLDDGDIGFLDFGIVGRFDDRQRRKVTDWIVAFALADYKSLANVVVDMGGADADVDRAQFAADLGVVFKPLLDASFGEVNFGEVVPKMQRVARRHNMTMPSEFVLITKQLLYFDRYAKLLAPELNIFKDPRLVGGMVLDIQKARAQN